MYQVPGRTLRYCGTFAVSYRRTAILRASHVVLAFMLKLHYCCARRDDACWCSGVARGTTAAAVGDVCCLTAGISDRFLLNANPRRVYSLEYHTLLYLVPVTCVRSSSRVYQ